MGQALFNEKGGDNKIVGKIAKETIVNIHWLHRLMEAHGLAAAGVKSIEEGAKAFIDAALDTAVEETNGAALASAGESALEHIDELSNHLVENEDLHYYRGAMVVIYTRCCKCICHKPWYGFGWIKKPRWECDKKQKSVFVLRNNGGLFSLDDFNAGRGRDDDGSAEGQFQSDRAAPASAYTNSVVALAQFLASKRCK
jgi:hypothetical protein